MNQVNSKTLTIVKELLARVKSLTDTVAAQQKTITLQQNTIAKLVGLQGSGGGDGGT